MDYMELTPIGKAGYMEPTLIAKAWSPSTYPHTCPDLEIWRPLQMENNLSFRARPQLLATTLKTLLVVTYPRVQTQPHPRNDRRRPVPRGQLAQLKEKKDRHPTPPQSLFTLQMAATLRDLLKNSNEIIGILPIPSHSKTDPRSLSWRFRRFAREQNWRN